MKNPLRFFLKCTFLTSYIQFIILLLWQIQDQKNVLFAASFLVTCPFPKQLNNLARCLCAISCQQPAVFHCSARNLLTVDMLLVKFWRIEQTCGVQTSCRSTYFLENCWWYLHIICAAHCHLLRGKIFLVISETNHFPTRKTFLISHKETQRRKEEVVTQKIFVIELSHKLA